MAQGYTGYNIIENNFSIKDGPNLDAFSRLRVSNALTIFSNQFTYDASPLIFEVLASDPIACQANHDSSERYMRMQFANAANADSIYMQSYEHIPYQPGRSQLVFITFNMFPGGTVNNNATRLAGLGDLLNGFFFQYNGATGRAEFVIATTTTNGTQIVDESNWNLDKLDGTGPSGITLDLTKTQILVIDFQALYVGRVRFGFDIDGEIIYAHEFLHANNATYPYIATANLPILIGMFSVVLALITEDMYFICCSVASEGGAEDAQRFGYNFSLTGSKITLAATLSYITSIRPRLTFNGITNRIKFVLESIEITNTGNRPAYYELGIGATLTTPTYNSYNAAYSAFEVDTTGTSTAAPTLVFESGHIPSGGGSKNLSISTIITSKYPITLDANGLQRNLGTLYLYANGIGGTTDIYYALRWKEIR